MNLRSRFPRWPALRVGVRFVCSFALAVGVGVLLGIALGASFAAALAVGSISVFVAAWVGFPSQRRPTKPTFPAAGVTLSERLTDDLCAAASPAEAVQVIEKAARSLVSCDRVEVEARLLVESGDGAFGFQSGSHKIARSSGWRGHEISVDLTFRGDKLGSLTAQRAATAKAFTPEEEALLGTIAPKGALALACAAAYSELERRRDQQTAAWRDEREALVETLSAEIMHEVRYPINFFRSIFQRASRNRVLDEDDIEIGCEEVDRLERLVSDLRRMANQRLERRNVEVAELCARAQALLRDRMLACRPLVDLAEGGTLRCDPDKITQVLVNLLANALEATSGRGQVGISWRSDDRGGTLEVWDTGPGFGADLSRLFIAGHTTKARGTGLGLAITYRLVRAHGWAIDASRRDARTLFAVTVPHDDIVHESDKHRVAGFSGEGEGPPASGANEGKVA
jgi:signal transduction histidine kinase